MRRKSDSFETPGRTLSGLCGGPSRGALAGLFSDSSGVPGLKGPGDPVRGGADPKSHWGPASVGVIWRLLMCLDIPCGDCMGNVYKHMQFTAMQERKREENTGNQSRPKKSHMAEFLGGTHIR